MLSILLASTSVGLGGSVVELTSADSVKQLIAAAMSSIHYFALTVALCVFLLAIVRNYTQFGDHGGVRFIASLLVVLVMIFSFPQICDSIQKATGEYSRGTSEAIENMFCWLIEQKPKSGKDTPAANMSIARKIAHFPESMLHSIQAVMCNIFYINGIYLGKSIRDIVYFIFRCLYNGALCLTPIFFAALLIPETRHTGVNFIISCIGITLMPLCFLFGDLCNIWLAEHMWLTLGLGSGGTFWTLVRSGQAIASPVGALLGYIAFGMIYALLAAIVYVIMPFLYMKLFRTGSPGSPIGLMAGAIGRALNTAIVGGSMAVTGGAAAPAAAGGASGAGGRGAAQAARSAARVSQSAGSEQITSGINNAVNDNPEKS